MGSLHVNTRRLAAVQYAQMNRARAATNDLLMNPLGRA